MNGNRPPGFTDIPLKIKPMKRFDYGLVSAKLEGLLFNVDRDLQRKTNEFATQQDWTATRQVVSLNAAMRFTKNSYDAVRYLAADTPEDHKRKPTYILVTPTINRQLLDLLFTLVYMFDDYPNRALEYEKAGWRESVEEYNRLHARFGKDPDQDWIDFFAGRKMGMDSMADYVGITAPQRSDLTLVPRWGTPTQLMRKKTASKAFLEWLYEWFYQDTSRNAHLSSSGLFSVTPFVLAEIVGGYEKEIVESHIIETFRFTQLSRLALIVLSIMSEVSTHFALGNYDSIAYLWQIFTDRVAEGKDLYEQRYKLLIDCSRT
jgi:hypothetical protein